MPEPLPDVEGYVMLEPKEFLRDWQSSIVVELRKIGENQQQTAVLLERLSGRIQDIEDWRQEREQDRRAVPAQRAAEVARAGTVAQWMAVGVAVLALVLSLASHISLH